jgi:hypothetical protein
VQVIVTIPNEPASWWADCSVRTGSQPDRHRPGRSRGRPWTEGDAQPFVMRVHHGRAVKTPVELGIRDVPSETVSIVSGLQPATRF